MNHKASKNRPENLQTGVDVWMIRDNLKDSYETRVARHQDTLDCIDSLKGLASPDHAKSSKTSSVSHPKSA